MEDMATTAEMLVRAIGYIIKTNDDVNEIRKAYDYIVGLEEEKPDSAESSK